MTEVPKIVYVRLRAATPEQAFPGQDPPGKVHPDADLLAGFTEKTLSAAERDRVLGHLSSCGDCREVIALALPAADVSGERNTVEAAHLPAKNAAKTAASNATKTAGGKTAGGWFSAFNAPRLRWAALAAAAVIVVAVLVARPGTLNPAKQTPTNPQVATDAPPKSGGQLASTPVNEPTTQPTNQSSTDQTVAVLKTEKELPHSEMRRSKKVNPAHSVAPPQESAATSSSEIQAENSFVPQDGLMAQNNAPPVIKAKPALGTETGQPQENIPNNVPNHITWTITAGVLQQSLDGGQTWREVIHTDHTLLCYASSENEQDVWTGGQAGTLFHSTDSGLTWVQVQPFTHAQQPLSDITHIELRSPLEIVVSTENKDMWISADGGRTWKKELPLVRSLSR